MMPGLASSCLRPAAQLDVQSQSEVTKSNVTSSDWEQDAIHQRPPSETGDANISEKYVM